MAPWLRRVHVAAVLVAVGVGCANKDTDPPKGGNGVDDVKLACEIRAKWQRSGNDCSLCESAVIYPACGCTSTNAFAAACLDQQNARAKVCAGSVDTCVIACDRTDCACIDACYANDECRKASAARDGCIANVCDGDCK